MSRPGYHGDQTLRINFSKCCRIFVADTLLHSMTTAHQNINAFWCFCTVSGGKKIRKWITKCFSRFYFAEATGAGVTLCLRQLWNLCYGKLWNKTCHRNDNRRMKNKSNYFIYDAFNKGYFPCLCRIGTTWWTFPCCHSCAGQRVIMSQRQRIWLPFHKDSWHFLDPPCGFSGDPAPLRGGLWVWLGGLPARGEWYSAAMLFTRQNKKC